MAPKYITADELATIIKSPESVPGKSYVVVDVRDDDRAGGHIKGSVNVPSNGFLMDVDELVRDTLKKQVKTVVFHCALSQVRGPKAARVYEETFTNHLQNLADAAKEQAAEEAKEPPVVPEIKILRDGFSGFQAKYRNDPELVEDWDKEIWEESEDWSGWN